MKKTILLFFIFSLLIINIDAKKKTTVKTPASKILLTNEIDSMSYALGISLGSDFGNYLKNIPGGKVNKEILLKGFESTIKEDTTMALTKDKALTLYKDYVTKIQSKEMEQKKLESEKFLTENKLKEGVQVTASGLQFLVLKSSEGVKPLPEDTVLVHYHGTLIDGKVFDSSVNRGEPIEFPLNGVIAGWTEGVQLMTVGSKYKFFIPYTLAYGERGIPQGGIPGFAALIFEVELLGIKKHTPKQEIVSEEKTEVIDKTPTPVQPAKKEKKGQKKSTKH